MTHYVTDARPQPSASSAPLPGASQEVPPVAPEVPVAPEPPSPGANDPASKLEQRILRKHRATLAKVRQQAAEHSSEWYNLSTNKEADKRGS